MKRFITHFTENKHWIVTWMYKKENHVSASDKNFICKPYLYEADKHMSTDNDNCMTIFFRHLKHNLEEKKRMSWVELMLRSYDLVAY
jgi:hypothetical protein